MPVRPLPRGFAEAIGSVQRARIYQRAQKQGLFHLRQSPEPEELSETDTEKEADGGNTDRDDNQPTAAQELLQRVAVSAEPSIREHAKPRSILRPAPSQRATIAREKARTKGEEPECLEKVVLPNQIAPEALPGVQPSPVDVDSKTGGRRYIREITVELPVESPRSHRGGKETDDEDRDIETGEGDGREGSAEDHQNIVYAGEQIDEVEDFEREFQDCQLFKAPTQEDAFNHIDDQEESALFSQTPGLGCPEGEEASGNGSSVNIGKTNNSRLPSPTNSNFQTSPCEDMQFRAVSLEALDVTDNGSLLSLRSLLSVASRLADSLRMHPFYSLSISMCQHSLLSFDLFVHVFLQSYIVI